MVSLTDQGPHAILFDSVSGINRDLSANDPDIYSAATPVAINNLGQIVGRLYDKANAQPRARLFTTKGSPSIDLGSIGGANSEANSINDFGESVGGTLEPSFFEIHAVFFGSEGPVDLGTLEEGGTSTARGINNAGVIVGWCSRADHTDGKPFLFRNGRMIDLNTLVSKAPNSISPSVASGVAINDWNQVACRGYYEGSYQGRAILLNPTDPRTTTNGNSTNIKFVAKQRYRKSVTTANNVFSFLDGVVGSGGSGPFGGNRDVVLDSIPNSGDTFASGAFDLQGISGEGYADVVAISIKYDESLARSLFGGEENVQLGWLNPFTQKWQLAVTGNSGGSANYVGDRSYNAERDLHLGTYGIDTANNVAWAVVNHSDRFAVVGLSTPVPVRVINLGESLRFGDVTVGSVKTLGLNISNLGDTNITIRSITCPPGISAVYSGVLSPGETKIVPVTFMPASIWNYSQNITVNSDANSGQNTLSVQAVGSGSIINTSRSLRFGDVALGSRKNLVLTIKNIGNAAMEIHGISFPMGFSGAYSGTLAAGATKTVRLTFKPGRARSYSGNIIVHSDRTYGRNFIAVSGTGI